MILNYIRIGSLKFFSGVFNVFFLNFIFVIFLNNKIIVKFFLMSFVVNFFFFELSIVMSLIVIILAFTDIHLLITGECQLMIFWLDSLEYLQILLYFVFLLHNFNLEWIKNVRVI